MGNVLSWQAFLDSVASDPTLPWLASLSLSDLALWGAGATFAACLVLMVARAFRAHSGPLL